MQFQGRPLGGGEPHLPGPPCARRRRPPDSRAPGRPSPAGGLGGRAAGRAPGPAYRCRARRTCTDRRWLGRENNVGGVNFGNFGNFSLE